MKKTILNGGEFLVGMTVCTVFLVGCFGIIYHSVDLMFYLCVLINSS